MIKLLSCNDLTPRKPGCFAQFAIVAMACLLHPAALLGAITYVQGNSATPQTSQTTVSVKFNAAQVAGDLNVVVVGWNDSTATVSAVTDTDGNAYTRAVGPTAISGVESQSIYYAKNITAAAAGANTVNVTFSAAAVYPDIRILEYSGADPANPVDVTAASSGNSATSSSGAATTTTATDLIFGANIVQTTTSGPGSGFTSRLLTSPDGDIAEDETVTAIGSYSATAPLSSGQWIMQMVAFRTPSGTGTSPTVSSVVPNSGSTAGGTAVTITGTNFASGATVTFGGTAATSVVVVNSTTITATTPVGGAGAVTVTVTNPGGQSGSLAGAFTYLAPPTVSSVSPNSGSTAGGTAVTITGTNFAAGATVTFGSTAATSVVVVNSTTITATTPAGSAGAVTVTVTVSGQGGSLTTGFTYVVVPTVSSVSPNNGSTAGGTAVTITGANFASGATVTFGGTAATSVVVVNSTTITATTPAHAAGAVTLTVTVNSQSGSLANAFTYIAPPTVSSISPNSGSTAGGTAVTITGTNFAAGATVTFGGTAATSVVVVNSTTITATTPAGSAGAVTVTVTNLGSQSGSLTNGFTYVVAPTVTNVSPNNGSTAGGTAVTITGTNFASGATVTLGGTAATSVVVVNSTTITAMTPAHAAGAITVTVTVNSQSGSLTNGFTYNGVLAITYVQGNSATPQTSQTTVSVKFNAAQVAGDLNVVVVGWNDSTATVSAVTDTDGNAYTRAVGPTAISGVESQSIYYAKNITAAAAGANTVNVTFSAAAVYPDIRILEYSGADPANPVDVTAASSGNSATSSSGAATTTTATDLIFGANIVQTTTSGPGSGFTSRLLTSPDGDIAEDETVTAIGSYSATAPLSSGQWIMQMVAFRTPSGTGTSPTVSSVVPNSGSTAGGTAVTITGTNFASGATVTFGGTAATSVVVVNSTTITATTPVGGAGAVTVTVTNPGGQSGSLAGAFTYLAPPTVSSVSPNSGSTAGGTAVTITGTNFAAGATVTFGSTAATSVVVVNSTTITATTPAGSAGAVTVTVTVSGQGGSLTTGFTYVVVPTVSSVSPNNGSTAGGTAVTITGANFASGATVTFGGTAATSVVVVNSTTITATTPAHAAGAVTLTVTVNSQSGSLANAFTYIAPPTVSSVSPNSGSTAGGTAVTITGTNFAAGATVTFGSTAATSVVVVNSTTITATTPAGSAGAVTVTVTVSGQGGSLTTGFRYVVVPTVSSVSPNNGSTAGGTAVTITGANFASGATVTFGGTAATSVVVVNSTTITATTPAHAAGAITVTVTVNSQSGSLANAFTYIAPPTVSSISPNSGSTAGGTAVTITGTNFAAGATVTFGGTAATSVVVVNSTTITATTPAGSAGAVTVTVTNPGSQSGSLTNGFTYVPSGTPTAPTGMAVVEGGPGPVYVNGQGYYNSTSLTSHTTAAFDSTGGDLIMLFASSHAGVTFTPSDNFGNTWIAIAGPTSTVAGFDLRSQVWYAPHPIVGAGHTITMGLSLAQPLVMSIVVVKGSNTSSPIDAISLIGSDNGTSTINVVSPGINTTSANDLLVGFVKTNGTETFIAGSGFTLQPSATVLNLTAETETATTSNTYDATFTLSAGVTWQSVIGAVTNNPNQTTLSWTASTETGGTISNYLVERCQGTGCSTFAQISSTTVTAYNDTGLTASTSYSYRVRAEDTVNTLGPYSSVVTISTPPVIPSLPGNLIATATSSTLISLSWTPSTETNGTVSDYLIERCQGTNCASFAQIGTTAGTTFNDTGVIASTSYSYRVRASDSSNSLSPYSEVTSATTLSSGNTISFVQGNYATPQTQQTTVSVKFNAAQNAGDLNVVVVGWNDTTATVNTVSDAAGNTYTRAVGPTTISSVESQSIYYAQNIAAAAAGANTVTITFSPAAAFPDIRILEYSGADPSNPVDVTAAGSGNSGTSSSGSVATTNATDLLFGANIVQTVTNGPGSGFTTRLVTAPDGDIAEDEMATAIGSYSATAPVNPGQWIMQMVAFRTPLGSTPFVTLSAASINFGNEQTGITSSVQPVTLTNVGSMPLTISSIAVSGGNAGDFAQTNNCGGTLTSNAMCTVNVTFTPPTTGARSSAVLITDNAPGSPQSIALSGTGIPFSVTPRVAALTFTRTQQFTASSGGVTWSVDGVAGGSAAVGTITAGGLYTPPSSTGTHTVTATTNLSQSASATVYVTNYPGTFTYHNDNLRTGQNQNETILTLSNVNQNQFGKLYSYALDGIAFASPLYVANVSIPGQGFHNLVYVATEHDSVYAFDADGLTSSPLWHVSFLSSGVTTVPCTDIDCGDLPVEFGITGTPVIDSGSGTLYVVAATKEGTKYVQRLHALDITTGVEKFGGPVVLQASVPGSGSGASGGNVPFDPFLENQRPGLLLSNGVVYLAFGSHNDQTPWHGWVLGYNATTLQQAMKYNVTPNGNGGGIWQGGGGLATDATGDIYFVTSNGDFDVNTGGVDYGDTIEKLSPSGSAVDYFTPHDQAALSSSNLDLGAGGPVMLVDQTTGPFPHLLIASGKGGTIYVINRDNLGHYNPSNDNQIVQSLVSILPNGTQENGNFSTPVYFNGYVYFGAVGDTLKAFQLTNGLLSTAPTSHSSVIFPNRGASFAISADGSTNGILWAIQNNGASPDNDSGIPGVLFAYNATNLADELYDSSQAGSRDTLDYAVKFSIPLVANGKVFVAGQTQLTVYGLLP